MQQTDDLHHQLERLIRADATVWSALAAARDVLGASVPWAVGAGLLRDLVWNRLHDAPASPPRDVDLAFFDTHDLSEAHEARIEAALTAHAELPWEARNQAGVHTWYHLRTGRTIAPYQSLEDAVASWPETATCVAATLDRDDRVRIIAPHGLADLFGPVLRRNPRAVTLQEFRERATTKRIAPRWPTVTIIDR